jgi:hypothetical protein
MSDDDDITQQLLKGDAYDEAEVTVRRLLGLSLDQKILVAIGTIAVGVLLGPAVVLGTDHITTLEPTLTQGDKPRPALAGLVLFGALGAFAGGLLLVWQRYRRHTQSFDVEQARRFVRIEDFILIFVLQGTLFVVVPTALAAAGALFPDIGTALYEANVRVYRPHPTFGIDTVLVSVVAGGLAAILTLVWYETRRRSRQ